VGLLPFFDLALPKRIDASFDNGLQLVSGVSDLADETVDIKAVDFTGDVPCVDHPWANAPDGQPMRVCGPAGWTFYAMMVVPFSSFAPEQPRASLSFTATMSDLTEPGTVLEIRGRAGFLGAYIHVCVA
jgi:hypothetical protein